MHGIAAPGTAYTFLFHITKVIYTNVDVSLEII